MAKFQFHRSRILYEFTVKLIMAIAVILAILIVLAITKLCIWVLIVL